MIELRGFKVRWECSTLAELHARDVIRTLEAEVGRRVRDGGGVGFEARMERMIRKLIARPTPPWGRGWGAKSDLAAMGPRGRLARAHKATASVSFDYYSGQLEVTIRDGAGVLDMYR